jgi:hypothetical protein
MEIANWEIIRLELKYCERCGGLGLRQRGTGKLYCAACAPEMSDFALCRQRIGRLQFSMRGKSGVESRDRSESLMMGGNA